MSPPDLDPDRYTVGAVPASVPGEGMPAGLVARTMPPPGSTRCMTGEICKDRHDLRGEHVWTSPPTARRYPWEMS